MSLSRLRYQFVGMACFGWVCVWGNIFSTWAGEKDLHCPTIIHTTEHTEPINGWNSRNGEAERALGGVSFYSIGIDGREYELAPDSQMEEKRIIKNLWEVHRYRDPGADLVLRCHYRNTSLQLQTKIPPNVHTCRFDAEIGSKGKVLKVIGMDCK